MTQAPDTCPSCGADVLDIDVKCGKCGSSLASTGAQRLVGTRVLEQYEIVDVLGQGGMSVVYTARHVMTGQRVALKVLPPELARHNQVRSRFLEEARALAQLDHPNIVHLYNFGEDQNCLVLAMQYIEGQTWERTIMGAGELTWQRSTQITIDVLKALEYAHARGIVHRDMKPSNVLLRESDGSATVMDFGIAKMTTSSRLTATGQTMGTVRYMSPEQVRGQNVDHRTDIYSLSCTLYESLLGDTPFDGETHFEIMTKHLSEPPPSLRTQGVDCPAALDAAVLRGLAKQRENRPRSAREMREMLEACLRGEEIAPPPREAPSAAPARRAPSVTPVESTAGRPRRRAGSEAALTAPSRPHREPRKARPILWGSLAVLVAAAGAGVVYITQRDSAVPARSKPDARAPAKAPSAWPEPLLLDTLAIAVDQRFEEDHVRVLSEVELDPEIARAAVVAGHAEFVEYLRGQKISGEIGAQPLNVVVVKSRHVLCDPRLHRGRKEVPSDCGEFGYHYLPTERTVYVLDAGPSLVNKLKIVQADNICLHTRLRGCDSASIAFGDLLTRRD